MRVIAQAQHQARTAAFEGAFEPGTDAARLIPWRECGRHPADVFRHADLLDSRSSMILKDEIIMIKLRFIVTLSKCRRDISTPGAAAGSRLPADVVLTGMGVRPLTNHRCDPRTLIGSGRHPGADHRAGEQDRHDIAEWRSL